MSKILVDYANMDWRGFLFVVHEAHGLMLLHCTRKPQKGPHWQLPGGHIDEKDFVQAGECFRTGRFLQLIHYLTTLHSRPKQ